MLEGVVGALAPDLDLAQVGQVEDPDPLAHRLVLGHGALVLDRHVPAGEGAHPGPEAAVDGVEGGTLQLAGAGAHDGSSLSIIRSERLALSRAL
jgi:hypothetical protein